MMNNNVNLTPNNPNTLDLANINKRQAQIADKAIYDSLVRNSGNVEQREIEGHLVPEYGPIVDAYVATKDMVKDAGNLYTALRTGKSDDHSLGRMNDLGMKMSGLVIAGYLATKAKTRAARYMEFIGFGTFFASMALWPKLLIDMPMKFLYGFNPRREYVDSQGRKKEFNLDNQFHPWDLCIKEDEKYFEKMGDEMGIPRDIRDRDELTKREIQAKSVQAQGLWVATAAVSPFNAALACFYAEKPLKKWIADKEFKAALASIVNFENSAIAKAKESSFNKGSTGYLNDALNDLRSGKKPKTEVFQVLSNALDPFKIDGDKHLLSDIGNKEFLDKTSSIKNAIIEDLKNLHARLSVVSDDEILRIIREVLLEENPKYVEYGIHPVNEGELRGYKNTDFNAFKDFIGLKDGARFESKKQLVDLINVKLGVNEGETICTESIEKLGSIFRSEKEVNKIFSEHIENFAKQMHEVKAKMAVAVNFMNDFMGEKEGSFTARRCAETREVFFELLKPTKKEIAALANEKTAVGALSDCMMRLIREGGSKEFVEKLSACYINADSPEIKKALGDLEKAYKALLTSIEGSAGKANLPEGSFSNLLKCFSEEEIRNIFTKKVKMKLDDINSGISRWLTLWDFSMKDVEGYFDRAFLELPFKDSKAINLKDITDDEKAIKAAINEVKEEAAKEAAEKAKIPKGADAAKLTEGKEPEAVETLVKTAEEKMSDAKKALEKVAEEVKAAKEALGKAYTEEEIKAAKGTLKELLKKAIRAKEVMVGEPREAFKQLCREVIITATPRGISDKSLIYAKSTYIRFCETLYSPDNYSDATKRLMETFTDELKSLRKYTEGSWDLLQSVKNICTEFHHSGTQCAKPDPSLNYSFAGESLYSNMKQAVSQILTPKRWRGIIGSIVLGTTAFTIAAQLFFGKIKDLEYYQNDEGDTEENVEYSATDEEGVQNAS